MFIPTAFSHIVKYIWTIPLSNMFKHFHALSNIFEEQQGICTRWGSIKSKSCLFQSAIPSHSCLSICPPPWGRSWWCERRENFAPARAPLTTTTPQTYLQCWYDENDKLSELEGPLNVDNMGSDLREELMMCLRYPPTHPLTWSTAVLRIVLQRTFKLDSDKSGKCCDDENGGCTLHLSGPRLSCYCGAVLIWEIGISYLTIDVENSTDCYFFSFLTALQWGADERMIEKYFTGSKEQARWSDGSKSHSLHPL